MLCMITHCGDSYECRDTGAVVAEAGDAAVVGSGRKEAGDGHNVGGNSYRFLEVKKMKLIFVWYSFVLFLKLFFIPRRLCVE